VDVCVAFAVSKRKEQSLMFESVSKIKSIDISFSALPLIFQSHVITGNGFLVLKAIFVG
jgi:hypothetical protein